MESEFIIEKRGAKIIAYETSNKSWLSSVYQRPATIKLEDSDYFTIGLNNFNVKNLDSSGFQLEICDQYDNLTENPITGACIIGSHQNAHIKLYDLSPDQLEIFKVTGKWLIKNNHQNLPLKYALHNGNSQDRNSREVNIDANCGFYIGSYLFEFSFTK